jgi:hypothetical protein
MSGGMAVGMTVGMDLGMDLGMTVGIPVALDDDTLGHPDGTGTTFNFKHLFTIYYF